MRIHIDPEYADLVRANTKFWNAGGLSFKIGLLGAQLKESSLESLISGGVAFASPDGDKLAPPADEGAEFWLASSADKEWTQWNPKIPIKSEETTPPPTDKSLLPSLLK